jgi:hypothetical protein
MQLFNDFPNFHGIALAALIILNGFCKEYLLFRKPLMRRRDPALSSKKRGLFFNLIASSAFVGCG